MTCCLAMHSPAYVKRELWELNMNYSVKRNEANNRSPYLSKILPLIVKKMFAQLSVYSVNNSLPYSLGI